MIQEKTIYLSYDLGLRGNYNSLYAWLDKYKARECGAGLAVLDYPKSGSNFLDLLDEELSREVPFNKEDRLYAIWREKDTNKLKGRFLRGSRKAEPWAGFSAAPSAVEDVEK